MTESSRPYVSIVIPVHNEEGILREAITDLRHRLQLFDWTYEILVCENGSIDRTRALAEHLAREMKEVRTLSVGEPNYGLAMRAGVVAAHGEFVI